MTFSVFFQFLLSKTGTPEQGGGMGVGEGNTEKREGEPNFLREIAVISAPPTTCTPDEKDSTLSDSKLIFLSFINLLFVLYLGCQTVSPLLYYW